MPTAKKDLWRNDKGKLVDEEPPRGTVVSVKGGFLSDADIKQNEIPADAFEADAKSNPLPPHIVMSGPAGQAFVTGQAVPEGQSVGQALGANGAKSGKGKDKDDKDAKEEEEAKGRK